MPGIEDWINRPLDIIQGLFDEDNTSYIDKVKEYFEKKLQDKTASSWVPSLNDMPLHAVQNNTLVRYRCMIQDMYDPELFLGRYEVKDTSTGETCLKSGLFKDIADCKGSQRVVMESSQNKTCDRQTLYCVPIPAETVWVKQLYCKMGGKVMAQPSTSSEVNRCKRPLEDEAPSPMLTETDSPIPGGSGDVAMETEGTASSEMEVKKAKTGTSTSGKGSSGLDLNFPLPSETGPACLVKIYENGESFKVNDTVEFIGIVSNDPAMVQFPDEEARSSALGSDGETLETLEDHDPREPPPSLVPRLHSILVHRLQHNNPQLPQSIDAEQHKQELERIISSAQVVREQLISILQQALLGDKVAAEFMLCHLISSVYARQDVLALGKFSVNLSGCPRESDYSQHIERLLCEILTKCHMLPLTTSNLNNLRMSPAKDYTKNRLSSGVLQLSDKTHLIVDETAMQPGQLEAKGVFNLTAIGNLVRWQKVEYDFDFHKQDFAANVPVLVVSEGKSLIQCDCHVPLNPTVASPNLDEIFAAIHTYLTPALLMKLRSYLTAMTLLPYSLPDDLQKAIEEDFVTMRKEDPKNLSVEDFHSLLVVARILSLSLGQTVLTRETWEQAKQLEVQRRARVPVGGATAQMA